MAFSESRTISRHVLNGTIHNRRTMHTWWEITWSDYILCNLSFVALYYSSIEQSVATCISFNHEIDVIRRFRFRSADRRHPMAPPSWQGEIR
jgi:hypothetical protein